MAIKYMNNLSFNIRLIFFCGILFLNTSCMVDVSSIKNDYDALTGVKETEKTLTLVSNKENTRFFGRLINSQPGGFIQGLQNLNTPADNGLILLGQGKFVRVKLHPQGVYEIAARPNGYREKMSTIAPPLSSRLSFTFEISDKENKISSTTTAPPQQPKITRINKTTAPVIEVTVQNSAYRSGVIQTNKSSINIKGNIKSNSEITSVTLNRKRLQTDLRGGFERTVKLKPGINRVVITALDKQDNLTTKTVYLERATKVASSKKQTGGNNKKWALIIGNSDYSYTGKLANPANDAHDISVKLQSLGFNVITRINAKQQEMESAITDFGRKLNDGGVGLFFYAGHGIQIDGANYLIPVDADLQREKDARYKAVNIGQVLDEMGYARNGLNIVVLDACRDNPFARGFRSGSRGLARTDAPRGTLIAFATSPGSVAADGDGRNGTYTKHFLEQLDVSGQSLETLFKRVLQGVDKETNSKQTPWVSSSFTGDFYFKK